MEKAQHTREVRPNVDNDERLEKYRSETNRQFNEQNLRMNRLERDQATLQGTNDNLKLENKRHERITEKLTDEYKSFKKEIYEKVEKISQESRKGDMNIKDVFINKLFWGLFVVGQALVEVIKILGKKAGII